ncbi:hypothetical protein [Ruegeria atlantica]|uniref:hypothetical protein n=1 Tax=Ruegeria atlantica TaxID=81569 RepID=UPI001479F278|nr:hypothetical protein [Ruegeria atlantica]
MAVEQNPDELNEIADAWFEDAGDAEKAWKVIARCIDERRRFPVWVLRFLRVLADDPPLPEEPKEPTSKAYYDPMDVFSLVSQWRQVDGKKPSLEKCFEQYINERLGGRGEEQTVKTAYYRGLRIAQNEIKFMQMLAESRDFGK